MKDRRAGFTLIEMMVVIVIIGILATVLIVNFTGKSDKARVETTKMAVKQLSFQVQMFRDNHNKFPDKLEDLLRMPSGIDPKTWPPGGYITDLPKDGWGRDFVYRPQGSSGFPFDIISLGADGREGGEGWDADIYNHDTGK